MILKTLLEKNYMEKWNIKTKPSCWFKRFKFVFTVFANVCLDSSPAITIYVNEGLLALIFFYKAHPPMNQCCNKMHMIKNKNLQKVHTCILPLLLCHHTRIFMVLFDSLK
jgi:hypothetical protein